MKILSISAQKPHSTGSGVYLMELVEQFNQCGIEQAVVAGVYLQDEVSLPENVHWYPVYYKTEELPFAIPGMSDEMPYESTIYKDITPEMLRAFQVYNLEKVNQAVKGFEPDVIICHHLYLLTALVREHFPEKKIYGICHNTDLRQLSKNPLKNNYIRKQICQLDGIFALQDDMKMKIVDMFQYDYNRIETVGIGYNKQIFKMSASHVEIEKSKKNKLENDTKVVRLMFAGKLSEKKGVISLLSCLQKLPYKDSEIELNLAGGGGNAKEYELILALVKNCKYKVNILGMLSQEELAHQFRQSDIFILPSFSEGLPLVVIEAMACGMEVVVTDLPGIQEWLVKNLPENNILYIQPPKMKNVDEIIESDVENFEQRLVEGIATKINQLLEARKNQESNARQIDVKHLSWNGVARKVIQAITN